MSLQQKIGLSREPENGGLPFEEELFHKTNTNGCFSRHVYTKKYNNFTKRTARIERFRGDFFVVGESPLMLKML